MHDISRFTIKNIFDSRRKLSCSCGQAQISLVSISRLQYLFKIFCVVCDSEHLIGFDSKKLWQGDAVKIYCPYSSMELGMAGGRQTTENIIACQKNAAFNLARELSKSNDAEEIENPSIMLEILNKIHDIAEQDGLYCDCGSANVRIDFLNNAIELRCIKCERRIIIPAKCEADRSQAEKLSSIELTSLA
jgi:hypothetical protein